MNLYKNRRDDYVRKRLQFDIDTILIYRMFATLILLWQTYASIQFQPYTFYHMYTNWTLFLTTIFYCMILYDDIFDVKYQWFHSLLFKMNIVLINATSIVVFFYWVTGANDFAKAPWLMFANHSWTMFTTPFEMLLSSNSKHLTMKHYYQYFVLFHFSWCFGLLPYHNPYKLPISFQEKPIGSTLLVLITSIVFSVIHYVYLKFFRNVNNVINKKKKDQ